MTAPTPTFDHSFLGHLFLAASQMDQQRQQSNQMQQREKRSDIASAAQQLSSPTQPPTSQQRQDSFIPTRAESSLSHSKLSPVSSSRIPVEASENDRCIRLRLNLSKIKASDVSVSVQRGILVIRGYRTFRCFEHDTNGSSKDSAPDGSVLKSHRFSRRYAVDTDVVDIDRLKANLSSSGILTVVGPKKNAPRSFHVAITEDEDDGPHVEEAASRPDEALSLPRSISG